MYKKLLSVGLDVGTSTTQLIVSELQVENRASSFAVPNMEIRERQILYKSPVRFTPLLDEAHVDGRGIREIVAQEYAQAGITRETVDTGAIIITGETARKENAQAVLESLSDLAGEFVVATAGPDLESRLAAHGAGAVEYSARTGKSVLHMDIGGGTSNLALIREGAIVETGCLNIGGRLIKYGADKRIFYVSPVLKDLTPLKPGNIAEEDALAALARMLAKALEMAAGLRKRTELLDRLITNHTVVPPGNACVLSFSGGIADCMEAPLPWDRFGDMGPLLGKAIRESLLCQGVYSLGQETIRATVIGAGCHSAQLSGSTVFFRDVAFPMKNIPVTALSREAQCLPGDALAARISQVLSTSEDPPVLALPGLEAPGYVDICRMADGIAAGFGSAPVRVALEGDMAKALGHALALRLPKGRPILCLDRVKLSEGSYLDVGIPVGPALPVVIKTLVLPKA